MRIASVEALVEINDPDSRPILRTRFSAEKDVEVRRAIALALGKLADTESLDILIAAFRDPASPEPVRDASLEAVEMIGTGKAVKTLTELLTREGALSCRPPAPGDRRAGAIQGRCGREAAARLAEESGARPCGPPPCDALVAIASGPSREGPGAR